MAGKASLGMFRFVALRSVRAAKVRLSRDRFVLLWRGWVSSGLKNKKGVITWFTNQNSNINGIQAILSK